MPQGSSVIHGQLALSFLAMQNIQRYSEKYSEKPNIFADIAVRRFSSLPSLMTDKVVLYNLFPLP